MGNRHQLFHIGIPKSGTTTVQKTLENDDRLLLTRSRYFTSKDWWVQSYPEFPSDKIIIESNETMVSGGFEKVKFSEVARRMYHVNPKAQVVLTIRKQEKALLSMYKYHIKYNHEGVKSFGNWSQETDLGMDYLSLCMFGSILKTLLGYFPKEQIHVLFFEALKEDPDTFYRKLYDIIGVPFRKNDKEKTPLNVMNFNEDELYTLAKLNSGLVRKDSWLHKADIRLKRRLVKVMRRKAPKDFFSMESIPGWEKIVEEFRQNNRYLIEKQWTTLEEMNTYGYTV